MMLEDPAITPAHLRGLKEPAGQLLLTGRLLCAGAAEDPAWRALFADWGLSERLPLDATLAYGVRRPVNSAPVNSDSDPA
jgi:hypothetical protein